MNFTLQSRGYFAGQFVVSDDTSSRSIGDYIEVTLKDQPFRSGETDIRGKMEPIFTFSLRVEFSCMAEPFDVDLRMLAGRSAKHWYECLEVGKTSVVIAERREYGTHVWYMPEIDGWKVGMFGKVKS